MTSPARRAGDASTPACRLMIFGRLPEPGRAKTRLAPLLGEAGAAELYRAFLDDTLAAAERVEAELELWVPRRPRASGLARRYPRARLRWQAELDLGGRLHAAFARAFGDGVERAVAAGSDHPTLPSKHLTRAFTALERVDVVLGPSSDGGYYAIGVNRAAWPRAEALFRGVPWSTSAVLERTRTLASRAGLRCEELPTWYDVDEPRELALLRRDLHPDSHTARVLAARWADG